MCSLPNGSDYELKRSHMPCMYLFIYLNSHVNMYIGMHDEDLMYCMRMISVYIYVYMDV